MFKLDDVIIHPYYNRYVGYDVAILKLERDLRYSREVRPICMPKGNDDNSIKEGRFPKIAAVVQIATRTTLGGRPP